MTIASRFGSGTVPEPTRANGTQCDAMGRDGTVALVWRALLDGTDARMLDAIYRNPSSRRLRCLSPPAASLYSKEDVAALHPEGLEHPPTGLAAAAG